MNITDIFIRKPVLSVVVSLLILILGLRSIFQLPIRQFPFTQNAVVTVTTSYYGANPELMSGFITTPLENSIAQANGIDYLTSSSTLGTSVIQAYLKLNYDSNIALSEINTKINSILNQLPKESQKPVITVSIGETINAMYIGFYSEKDEYNQEIIPSNKITDYLIRVVQPILKTVDGVQTAEILGSRQFALRAWLIPEKLAAYKLTATDISKALTNNNFISAIGRTDGQMVAVNLSADTGLHTVEEFKNLIIKTHKDSIVRLQDVAHIVLGSENYDNQVKFDGQSAVFIGVKIAPAANLLTVMKEIKKIFPSVQHQLPIGLKGKIVYDSTKYVNSSIYEVVRSLLEALLVVTGVIFLFLGTFRSVIIPVIAIPLSLIGVFFIMLILGYSINLLTLLALVLAIGLVVDDAIIIVENIHRYIESGKHWLESSLMGAKELSGPIIVISIVLIAVYLPIGFMEGLTGALFTEFAFTLAGAVGVSAIIALTLSPMMCSKLFQGKLTEKNKANKLISSFDYYFEKLSSLYKQTLNIWLNQLSLSIVFSIVIILFIPILYTLSKQELAPQEDQGVLITMLTAAPNASLYQTSLYSSEVYRTFLKFSETDHVFQLDGINGLNSGIAGMVLKPWGERKLTADELQPKVQEALSEIPGLNIAVFQRPPLPGSNGLPFQIVIKTTETFLNLNEVVTNFVENMQSSGIFMFLDSDLKINKLETKIKFDRNKTALLGLNMMDLGNMLGTILGGGYVNYFSLGGRSYKVIPQASTQERINDEQLLNYHITTANGHSIPLSTVATLERNVTPESLNHFQQLNSATISGVLLPEIALGDAINSVQKLAENILPQNYYLDYAGQSRQYIQESSSIIFMFLFAIIIIFLTLSAQFNSFRDSLIVLISVPMSICGAMIFICLGIGGISLNIYTEVGLVTLIGLISKHGILIVQFSNDLLKSGKNRREAIEEAASIRLRPILMTTAAMVFGVIPLIFASGAGALSRYNIGVVIATGISIGTFFTLFIVPALYMLLSSVKSKSLNNKFI